MVKKKKKIECSMCGADATWMRATQFAGNHPFCTKHAKEEDDFLDDDSSVFWYELNRKQQLWELCYEFIDRNNIHTAETVYQTDKVIENACMLIEHICNIVGYKSYEN